MRGSILLFAAGCLAVNDERVCPTTPEIMVVQDSSASLETVHKTMSKDIGALLSDWAASYGTPVKIGFSSFTDKPLPMRGWGGRYAHNWEDIDTCWDFGTSITLDHDVVQENFDNMILRNGGDFAETQMEALLYAAKDPRVGFSDPKIVRDAEDRLVNRMALLITDDVPHVSGDALAGIQQYNGPRQPDGYGGWGDANFFAFQGGVWQNNSYPYTTQGYRDLAELIMYKDLDYDLYPDEQELFDKLSTYYGPSKWETTVVPHDGEYTKDSCKTKDYPTLKQVKAALMAANVLPVVLVTSPGQGMIDIQAQLACRDHFGYAYDDKKNKFKDPSVLVPCLVWHYSTAFESAGIDAVVSSFTSAADVVDAVKKAVLAASDYACNLAAETTESAPVIDSSEPTPEPTPAPPVPTEAPIVPTEAPTEPPTVPTEAPTVPTEPPTVPTEAPTVPTEPPTVPTEAPTEPPTVPTEAPTVPTEAPIVPTEAPTAPVENPDTTGEEVPPIIPAEEEGSNTAVIAGAAGGAVAGVAAIAGLLYKQFGAGLFGNTPSAEIAAAEQVDAPETRVEREGVEEVTMDMFQ